MPREEYPSFAMMRRPAIIRKESCTLNDVHDFGCQITDDSKNDGWSQGLIVCVKQNGAGEWVSRILGNLKEGSSLDFAIEHMVKALNDEFSRNGCKLRVIKDE